MLLGLLGMSRAELLVDQHAGRAGVDAARSTACMPSKIRCLASVIVSVCSGVGSPSIPNIFFWNEPAVVEREDVELAVVAECHAGLLVVRGSVCLVPVLG